MLSFGRRTAVITGGSKTIGLSIAKQFANAGLNIAIISSNPKNVESALKELDYKNAMGIVYDLNQTKDIETILTKVNDHFGSIDIIVNNAGILDMDSIEDSTEEKWDEVLGLNLKAPFFLVQKALPYLKKASHPRVINISSNAGRMGGFANGLSYSASKGGLISLTYGLARQLAKYGITVNCIAPGTIESEMLSIRDSTIIENLLQRFPLGRFGKPDEVANSALYFASLESDFTTGAVLDINGGLFMG
jgi:3-oxoacyl-[acyl-carrier protein] reductase